MCSVRPVTVDGVGDGGGAEDPVARLRDAVDVLLAVDLGELSDPELAGQVLGLRREIDRAEAGFARRAALAHRRGLGAIDGAASTAAWLRTRAGMSQSRAQHAIRAGGALEAMPLTAAAWAVGEISADHAGWITQAWVAGFEDALAEIEPVLVGHARRGELRELKAGLCRIRELTRPESIYDERGLSLSRTFRGAVVGELTLDAEGGEVVLAALEAYTEPPTSADDRTHAQRRADGLVALCRAALDLGAPGRVRGTQCPHISMLASYDTVRTGAPGVCELERGGPISPATARRLACDATISRVLTDPEGIPLDVGRSRRTVPPPLRRAVVARDRGCRFPGCDRPPGRCQVHHVIHWIDGGRTMIINLVLLCSHHHHLLHESGWTATFDGHHLRVYRPDGTELDLTVLAA